MFEFFPPRAPLECDWQPPADIAPAGAGPRRRAERKIVRRSWFASGGLHALATAIVAAEVIFAILFVVPTPPIANQVELAGVLEREAGEQPPELASLPIQIRDDATARTIADEQIAHLARHAVDPQLERQLLQQGDPAGESLAAAWIAQRVADEIAAAEKLTPEEKFQHLEQLTGTLNRVSSAESVDAIASRLQTLFGTSSRAVEPAKEPVPGEFDLDTAQLHDVKRTSDGEGSFSYVGVLLDAQGRTQETPLDAAEGENLFRLMELIKSNPLLERVYRGIVMSLMDKMLKTPAAAEPSRLEEPSPAP